MGVIRSVFESHGFEALETPALERLETLMGKYGEEGDQLLFKLLRRGEPLVQGIRDAGAHIETPENLVRGRSGETAPRAEPMLSDLGLRYDLTVPLARVVAGQQGKLPAIFKRYQMQPVWRADTPGKGRFREFYQCDLDVVGSTSLVVEAEVLSAAAECMRGLGFGDFRIRINHRALLRSLIELAGIEAAREVDAIVAIDKLDKIGLEGVREELERRGFAEGPRTKLLSLLGDDLELDGLKQRVDGHTDAQRAIDDLSQVFALARETSAADHLHFDLTLARGLSYYTGCIFELPVPDLAGSLGGGGRYDGLIGMFLGREVPACGLTVGLERILVVMQERGMFPEGIARADVLLAPVGEAELVAALRLAGQLRSAGISVDLSPKALKPGKLRQQAEQAGIAAAVWLEPGASERGNVWLRQDGSTHKELRFDDIEALIGRPTRG